MNTRLRTTHFVIAVYLLILGILFTFFPSIAETVFGIALPDAALTMLYGQVVLTLAYLAYRVGRDVVEFAKLYAVFVALFGGHIVVFLFQIFTGVATFAQNGPPLVISIIFTTLLLLFGRK
jgi:hypothetical protein